MIAGRGVFGMLGRLLAFSAIGLALVLAALTARALSVDVDRLAEGDPGRTALMRQREREAARSGRTYRERRHWVPYSRISPALRHAVLVAEDDAFFAHGGLDWNEIRESAKRNWEVRRFARGGSTITQQLAKNLWLGTSRSPLRKYEELILALRLERALGKRRIFELYLNLIEWGDGVYGAEAAARRWFGTGAGALTEDQGVRLAAVIINPRRYSPTEPSRRIERRMRMIRSRLRRRGQLPAVPAPAAAPQIPTPAPFAPPPVTPVPSESESTSVSLTPGDSPASFLSRHSPARGIVLRTEGGANPSDDALPETETSTR